MAGTVEGVITGPAALKVGLAALLRRYRPAEGQSWLSAKLTVELPTHEESFTVVNLPPPSSPEESGRPGTNPAWDSAHQNHEECPGGKSRHSSSPEISSQIENAEMIVEAVGGSMPLGQASGSDATLSTAFEFEVKSEERVELEDWSVTSVQATDPMSMTDERAEGESQTLDDFTDMPDLSMEPQIDVQGQSLQATEDEGTGGEGMETDDSNYEPDCSDENGRDSEDEPMVNLAISNARTLPESAVKTPNLPGVAHLDKTEVKNQSKNPCNICGKGFVSKYNLRRHISHIHDRPKRKRPTRQFKCKECGSAYKYKFNLKQHLRVHRADCPFRCNLCQKPWPSKRALERHVRSHTGERPFQCPICETEWAREDHLANHVRKVHKK